MPPNPPPLPDAPPRLRLVKRRTALVVLTSFVILVLLAGAGSFLLGPYPRPAGTALFGGMALVLLLLLGWVGRTERIDGDGPSGRLVLSAAGIFGRSRRVFTLAEISHAAIDRESVASTHPLAGTASVPLYADAERPVLVLADGRRLPVWRVTQGTVEAEFWVASVNDWLAAWRGSHPNE